MCFGKEVNGRRLREAHEAIQQYEFIPEAGCEARSRAALEGTATAPATSVTTTRAFVAATSYATTTGLDAARGPRE